jgi:hypothetical protein
MQGFSATQTMVGVLADNLAQFAGAGSVPHSDGLPPML